MPKSNSPFGYSSWKAFFLFNLEDFLDLIPLGSLIWVWIVLMFLMSKDEPCKLESQKNYFFAVLNIGKQVEFN